MAPESPIHMPRNTHPITTRIYLRAVEEFARYYKKSPDQLGPEQVREYQAHLFTDRKLGAIAVAQQLSALRFFFVRTLKRPLMAEQMASPKRPIRLPEVLSREEVERLIESAASPLHRIWLLILYATGIRREELVHLKISGHRQRPHGDPYSPGQGQEGSRCHAQPTTAQELRDYWRRANPRPTIYLFPRQRSSSERRRSRCRAKACSMPCSRRRQRAGLGKRRPPAYAEALLRHPSARIRRRPAHDSTPARPCRSEDDQPLSASVGAASQGHRQPARFAQPCGIPEAERRFPQEVNEAATPGVGRYHSRRGHRFMDRPSRLVHLAAPESPRRHRAVPHRRDGRPSGSVLRLRPSRHLL